MTYPVGTLCLVKNTSPEFSKYLGCSCEVITHGRYFEGFGLRCTDLNFIHLSVDGFEILAHDWCLMPIKPAGESKTRRVDKPEPVAA